MKIYTMFILLLECCLSNALLTKASKQHWFRERGGDLKTRTPAELLRNKIKKQRPDASESGWRFLDKAHIETQATQPTQGRAAQVSVTHTCEYVSAS